MYRLISLLMAALLLTSCHPKSLVLDPGITYVPQARQFRILPSDFPPLTQEELKEDWGKELKIAIRFARDLDLYRAITSYKRALFLIPQDKTDRVLQIEYSIMLCYYLGQKFDDAVNAFEDSHLSRVPTTFPAFRDLVIILYDSYKEINEEEKAEAVFHLLEKGSPNTAKDLQLFEAIEEADIPTVCMVAQEHPKKGAVDNFLSCYCMQSKSVRKAQVLNAVLPGAGYFYVGQKNTALTSFLINASFIAASVYLFEQGNYVAGVITSSLELGWYLGGINGAGLAAKEWNQHVYRTHGKELLIELGLFPVLMIGASF